MKLFMTAREVIRLLSVQLDASLNLLILRINKWAEAEHHEDGTHSAITVDGVTFNGTTQTTVGAAGGASALPATPLGYLVITVPISGIDTEVVVPYFVKA